MMYDLRAVSCLADRRERRTAGGHDHGVKPEAFGVLKPQIGVTCEFVV